jgi:hypothetical protein
MAKTFRTLIVSAQIAPFARQLSAGLPAGFGMFVAAYSPTGAAPATHFVSEGWIDEEFAAALASPEALVAMLAAYGQALPLAQAQGILAQAIVEERDALTVLSELGLLPVGEDE